MYWWASRKSGMVLLSRAPLAKEAGQSAESLCLGKSHWLFHQTQLTDWYHCRFSYPQPRMNPLEKLWCLWAPTSLFQHPRIPGKELTQTGAEDWRSGRCHVWSQGSVGQWPLSPAAVTAMLWGRTHGNAVRTDSPQSAALLSSTPGGTTVFLAAGAWPAQPQELRSVAGSCPTSDLAPVTQHHHCSSASFYHQTELPEDWDVLCVWIFIVHLVGINQCPPRKQNQASIHLA